MSIINITSVLETMYCIQTNKDFNVEFPKVELFVYKFVLENKRINGDYSRESRMSLLWKKLCDFTNKKDNFKEDDIKQFFENLDLKSRYLLINMNLLLEIYHRKTNRDFKEDFPNVVDNIKHQSRLETSHDEN